jgi:predicted aldo/keto reductase-like oxidoreductase
MYCQELGTTGISASRFGLGCMRLPKDEREAVELVRYAIDHGVNYLDTAYVYAGSEDVLGRALAGGYRERVTLVSKAPVWFIKSHADFEQALDTSLRRLNTDYLDFYLLHNLFEGNLARVEHYGGYEFLDEMLAKGKIRFKGFSIHNTFPAFKRLVDEHSWDMAQVQMNILDVENQVTLEALSYGADKGLPMVIMEPLRGGNIINNQPPEIANILAQYPMRRSLAEWCFRWLYSKPEASVILSGASTLEQLKENLAIFADAAPYEMSAVETRVIDEVRAAFEAMHGVACTGCRYCMPCPTGVDIPAIFKTYNNYCLSGKSHVIDRMHYRESIVPQGMGADQCAECGACTQLCPQALPIPDLLAQVHAELLEPTAGFKRPESL